MQGMASVGGLSKARLGRMHDIMAGHVDSGGSARSGDAGQPPGRGSRRCDRQNAFGGAPMRRDTIFRITSMTKPMTAAAAMILVEECKLRLDDPVDPWLPELADRKVLRAIDAALDDTVPARRAITVRDLLTFRSGSACSWCFPTATRSRRRSRMRVSRRARVFPSFAPDELMQALCHSAADLSARRALDVPYADRNPGRADRARRRQPLGDFSRERIFSPLGMKDTGFSVPAAKLDRLATCYTRDHATGELKLFDDPVTGNLRSRRVFETGSAGLVSTADDYLRFAQMMLNGGRHGSERILSRPSVELMTTDHLTPEQKRGLRTAFRRHQGWGLGLSVFTRRDGRLGVPGRFGWDGG